MVVRAVHNHEEDAQTAHLNRKDPPSAHYTKSFSLGYIFYVRVHFLPVQKLNLLRDLWTASQFVVTNALRVATVAIFYYLRCVTIVTSRTRLYSPTKI